MPTLILRRLPAPTHLIAPSQELVLDQNPLRFGRYSTWPSGMPESVIDETYRQHLICVSRTHFVIRYESGVYTIEDTNSRNGTYINNRLLEPGVRRILHCGDRIYVTGFEFLFQGDPTILVERTPLGDAPTLDFELTPAQVREVFFASQPNWKLQAVLELTTILGESLRTEEALPLVAERLLSPDLFAQADRCSIVQLDDQNNPYQVAFHLRQKEAPDTAPFSHTAFQKCLEAKDAIMFHRGEVELTGDLLRDPQIFATLCAPLLNEEKEPIGVIQLDTKDSAEGFSDDDLMLLGCIATQCSRAIEKSRTQQALRLQKQLTDQNKVAKSIQKTMLPQKLPELREYEFFSFHKGAQIMGGDFYDFVQLPDGKLVVLIGTVSGRGVAAAVLSTRLLGLARQALHTTQNLADAMQKLNNLWFQQTTQVDSAMLTMLRIDPVSHTVEYVNAGKTRTWIYQSLARRFEQMGSDHPSKAALGSVFGETYIANCLTLELGDFVCAHTEGIELTFDLDGNPFGRQGILQFTTNTTFLDDGWRHLTASSFGRALTEKVTRFRGDAPLLNDQTVVAFGRKYQPLERIGRLLVPPDVGDIEPLE